MQAMALGQFVFDFLVYSLNQIWNHVLQKLFQKHNH